MDLSIRRAGRGPRRKVPFFGCLRKKSAVPSLTPKDAGPGSHRGSIGGIERQMNRPAARAIGMAIWPNTRSEARMMAFSFCRSGAAIVAMVGIGTAAVSAHADPVADFYHGKTLSLIIGTSSGNDYDFRARLLARHLGRHIPGEPTIIPQNMPGVGGVKAANYLASIAPHDGTTLHMIMSNMMSSEAIGAQGVQFDTRKFFWIGNTTSTPNVTVSWFKSGVTSVDQVKTRELIVGAPGGTAGVIYVTAMNGLLGTKFKLVTGYPGGNEVNLAMERGEVDGRASNSWAAWKSTHPEWVMAKKIVVLAQIGLQRTPDL